MHMVIVTCDLGIEVTSKKKISDIYVYCRSPNNSRFCLSKCDAALEQETNRVMYLPRRNRVPYHPLRFKYCSIKADYGE